MTRSILCALAALVFLYAWVTFPDFSAAYVATDAGGNFSDAATAAAGALRLLSLGLGLLAAGCVDWKWVGGWIAGNDRSISN